MKKYITKKYPLVYTLRYYDYRTFFESSIQNKKRANIITPPCMSYFCDIIKTIIPNKKVPKKVSSLMTGAVVFFLFSCEQILF